MLHIFNIQCINVRGLCPVERYVAEFEQVKQMSIDAEMG